MSSSSKYNVIQTAAAAAAAAWNRFVYSNGKGIARAIKIICCFIIQAIPRMTVSCISVSGTWKQTNNQSEKAASNFVEDF